MPRGSPSLSKFRQILVADPFITVRCGAAIPRRRSDVNAFFVREDLAKGQFAEPFTAENHHQPPQYYLTYGFFSRDPVERPPGE
jgi:hypothetical protein